MSDSWYTFKATAPTTEGNALDAVARLAWRFTAQTLLDLGVFADVEGLTAVGVIAAVRAADTPEGLRGVADRLSQYERWSLINILYGPGPSLN